MQQWGNTSKTKLLRNQAIDGLSWQSWMSACQNEGQYDRHVSVRPTCCRHVGRHVDNTKQKAVGRGTRPTCHSMSLAYMSVTCRQHACLSHWHLCRASLFRHCLLLLLPYLVSCCVVRHPLFCTPSCNHQRSLFRMLLPPIIVYRRPCHHCCCRRATTAATATIQIKLTVIHYQRKTQQQQHHQRTNGSTNVKMFTCPDNLDLFNLSTVFFHPWGYVLQYL